MLYPQSRAQRDGERQKMAAWQHNVRRSKFCDDHNISRNQSIIFTIRQRWSRGKAYAIEADRISKSNGRGDEENKKDARNPSGRYEGRRRAEETDAARNENEHGLYIGRRGNPRTTGDFPIL